MKVFIVGSPRSGTTLLGNILHAHPSICRWYEPHFVINRHFRNSCDDLRNSSDATPEISRYIQKEFDKYERRMNCSVIIDKSPMNSLKIPFLRSIFPYGRFVHIIRDGRDATLSINKEWVKRKGLFPAVNRSPHPVRALKSITEFVNRQDTLDYMLRALLFELQPSGFFRKGINGALWRIDRWNGMVGWGPQFKNWEAAIQKHSLLEFNAMQWQACVNAILQHRDELGPDNYLEIRYESFLDYPEENLSSIFDFLEVRFPDEFMSRIPSLNRNNYGKWENAFTPEEKAQIGPILHPLLEELGYADSPDWYDSNRTDE